MWTSTTDSRNTLDYGDLSNKSDDFLMFLTATTTLKMDLNLLNYLIKIEVDIAEVETIKVKICKANLSVQIYGDDPNYS